MQIKKFGILFLLAGVAIPWKASAASPEALQGMPAITQSNKEARTLSGVVTDEFGEPLPGVTIGVEGTNIYTVTSIDGKYVLNLPEKACTIKFSYVGMEPQDIKIAKGNNNITGNVELKSHSELQEVVVTGYQNIAKTKMTGAETTVGAKELDNRYTTNLTDNLEGRISGLSTYNGKISIRGTSSLYASTNPLLVVDGLPVEGSIDDLNMNDIASVTVLKDAAATAIYGARASNGIIVVTTKNATGKGRIDVDFSTDITVYEKRNVDYHDNFRMNAAEQVAKEADYWNYYFFNNNGEVADPIGSVASDIMQGQRSISPIQYAFYQQAQGLISDQDVKNVLNKYSKNNFAKEFADNVLRRQVIQQYNLAVRGKSEKMQNNLTLNYKRDNQGQMNSYFSSLNVNYKGIFELAKWLQATASVNAVFSKTKEAGNDYGASYNSLFSLPAYESMYNDDGTFRPLYYMYSGSPYWNGADEDGIFDLGVIPMDELRNNTQTTRHNHLRFHGELLFRIIEGLTANAKFIYENDDNDVKWHANAKSHVSRTIRNVYAQPDAATGRMTFMTPENGGMLRSTDTKSHSWTFRGQINYDKTFGKHYISAIAGLEFRDVVSNGLKTLLLGYDEQLQSSANQNVNLGQLSTYLNSPYYMMGGYPAQYYVYDRYLRDGAGLVPEEHHRFGSGYFNASYTYDNKYNVFGSVRKDYADVYGLNSKFRGSPLWSVGAAWNIDQESFMHDVEWVDMLKPRVSYGVTGNIYQSATSYMTATSTEVNRYAGLPMGAIESPANPNLKWEKNRTLNVGIDFAVLNFRLRGAIDYYDKKGSDIFSNRMLDSTTGFSSMFMNTASMYNRGVEFSLNAEIIRPSVNNGFGWNASLTASYNKNKITSVENPSVTASQLIANPFREGYPTSALWSYRFAGISADEYDRGSTLWYVEDGNTVHSASTRSIDILEFSGQTEPKVNLGLNNTFSWNGLRLSFLTTYYGGHVMRVLAENEMFGMPYSSLPSYLINSWTPENPTNTPGIGQYYARSTSTEETQNENTAVHSADILRVRYIALGYDFPRKWCKALGLTDLGISLQINNPNIKWTKNDVGIDPETLGVRQPTSFVFGLNLHI